MLIELTPPSESESQNAGISPILRWAGGKRWLIPKVKELVSEYTFNSYYEPFLGGAAMFFGNEFAPVSHLNDSNAELIEMYRQVREYPTEVSVLLESYVNSEASYYALRGAIPEEPLERAARFIFLNHTSYNGIYRVNLRGDYNVPYGARKSINLPTEQHLRQISARLKGATLTSSDFQTAVDSAAEGDLVFLDPPYTVAHNNNGFVKYNQKLFSFADQERLCDSLKRVADKGAFFILTNAAHESIEQLFGGIGRRLTISRGNSIGGSKAARGRAEEYLFTNISMGER